MRKIGILTVALLLHIGAVAQTSELLNKYRTMALNYNHDLKAAEKNIATSIELEKMARSDRKPQLGGAASFSYTGNPTELSLSLPTIERPISFQGGNMQYGASLSLLQPVYTGGRVLETIRQAQHRQSMATNQALVVRSSICYQVDIQYWNTVARRETMKVATDFRNAVDSLVCIIRQRVEEGMVEPQDLLMAEVKLNEAEYQLLQASSSFETGRMALNSIIGVELNEITVLDSDVPMPMSLNALLGENHGTRAEVRLAEDNIRITESNMKLEDSKYRPQLYVGADGSYSSPGYNFKADLNPNYVIHAKLSVPIYEWGKRRSSKISSKLRVGMATDELNRIQDRVDLEAESAKTSFSRACDRVKLTQNSLDKAVENERKAMERYIEGRVSVVEVIDAQVYRQNAQMNFIQAKAEAQGYAAELCRAINGYEVE